jgi:outer membrane protein W
MALLLMATTAETLPAQAEDACAGYDKNQRIQRLAVHPVSKKPAADQAALAHAVSEYEAEFRALLEARGLGAIADELMAALKSGDGVTERALSRGETFQWMTFREKGALAADGPRCLDTRKDYAAFEVTIRKQTAPANPPRPSCEFTASGDCAAKTLSVDASKATDGVVVTQSGHGAEETILSGGETTWSGPYENRFRTTYAFTANAVQEVTGTETAYTFVIPKACVNLALSSVETREVALSRTTCETTHRVEPCPAPEPSCTLTLSADKVRVGEQVEIRAAGHWDTERVPEGLRLEVSDGTVLGPELPAYYDAEKAGTYTVTCTATNEVDKTATATATFEVVRPWTVRVFGAGFRTDDEIATSGQRSPTVLERSKLSSHSGEGLGVSVEYNLKPKLGLEGALLLGNIDARYTLDLNDDWGMDADEYGLLAVTFGPNFHLTPDRRVDFYIGPFVGFASIDEPSFTALGETFEPDVDSEFIWGAQLGLDIPFQPDGPWAFHLGIRYMGLSAGDLDLDPLVGTAGVAYRF